MEDQPGHENQTVRYCESPSGLWWSRMNSEADSVENICYDSVL